MPRYNITIQRTSTREKVISLIATDENAAAKKAMQQAGDLDFSQAPEFAVEYEAGYVAPKSLTLRKRRP